MLDTRIIERVLRDELGLDGSRDVIAHVRMASFGKGVRGGPAAVAAALLATSRTLVMPAFTLQTMIIPQSGPPDNNIAYGTGDDLNARAAFFRPDLPVHPDMGVVAETLRQDDDTLRSTHPILSFIANGPDADEILSAQTRKNPLGPIALLEARNGMVLLIGTDQRDNISLHLAEQRAGRKTYIRWALTLDDIEELHYIPGSRDGFNDVWRDLLRFANTAEIGMAHCEALPLRPMLQVTERRIRQNPQFMLRGAD